MPIQDDIHNANLGRLEREAQRQKKAAQQAPTVQYMGTDGVTGRVRVISGSGASSVGVANHSNTQARPGDIKRGFAGGFDRGNVRRLEKVIRPRKPKETGNTRVLYIRQSDRQLYVGGHIEEPLPTGIIIPANSLFNQYYIEDIGAEDNDHVVSYSYYNSSNVRTIGSYNGNTGNKWEIQGADPRFSYRRYGVFSTDLITLSLIIPGTNNMIIDENTSVATIGLLFPTYLQTGNEIGSKTTRTFTGNGYQGTIPAGLSVTTHTYYQQNKNSSCDIPYGYQTLNEFERQSSHSSTTLCLRARSASVEQITGSQSYNEDQSSYGGKSESGGQPGDAFKYDDFITGFIDHSTTSSANLPIATGRSDVLQGSRSSTLTQSTPAYTWQHLISIPAPYGFGTGVDPAYYQSVPSGLTAITEISSSSETIYRAGDNIGSGYYYIKESTIDSVFTLQRFLDDGREVVFRLYNSEIKTTQGDEFRYTFNGGEASFFRLTNVRGKLDYEDNRAFNAELKTIQAPPEYSPVGAFVPVYKKLDVIPA